MENVINDEPLILRSEYDGGGTSGSIINSVPDNNEKKSRPFAVEPVIVLVFFTWALSGAVFQNLIIYQSCTVYFGFNSTICNILGTQNMSNETKEIEILVQPHAAKIMMAQTIIEGVIPAIVSLFIGPWSDKFGRKPVIITTLCGYFLIYFSIAVISFISTRIEINPWYYIIAYIPVSFFGGTCAFITATYCYIIDNTNQENRARRLAFVEAAVFTGLVIGSLASSYIYELTSPTFIFVISAFVIFISILYSVFFVDEYITNTNNSQSACWNFTALFNYKLVTDMVYTCVKRRDNFDRTIIWLLIATLGASIFVLGGSMTVFYLYARTKFNWTLQDITFYNAGSIVIQIFGNIFGMYILNKYFGMSPIILAILSFISSVSDYIIKALSIYTWQLYIALGAGTLKALSGPMCRSVLAQIVPSNEIGKIFAITSSIEALSPLGSAPLYTFVYTNTLVTFPGAFNLISAGVFMICTFILFLVYILQKKSSQINYAILDN